MGNAWKGQVAKNKEKKSNSANFPDVFMINVFLSENTGKKVCGAVVWGSSGR